MIRFLTILFISLSLNAQNGFYLDKNKKHYAFTFQKVGNLIMIPIQVNESKTMRFILDTGSSNIVLTDFLTVDNLRVVPGKEVEIHGLGKGIDLSAYDSRKNRVQINKHLWSDSARIILVYSETLKLSQKLGVNINGIIGFDVFENFVVRINYRTSRIHFYERDYFYQRKFKPRKRKKYQSFDIKIINRKPYYQWVNPSNNKDSLSLLIDSGSIESMWVFRDSIFNSEKKLQNDFLGYGLNGEILGTKYRLNSIQLFDEIFENPITAIPDSAYVKQILGKWRSGSIGAEILYRFDVIFDYQEKKIFLKPTNDIKKNFKYNRAGIEVYVPFEGIPIVEVMYVRKGSSAEEMGLKPGDYITKINNEPADYKLVHALFYDTQKKRISLTYNSSEKPPQNVTIQMDDQL